jgi:hypothetical protein
MRKRLLISLLSIFSLYVSAQSKSYQTLYDGFSSKEDVVAFSLSGTLCRSLEFFLKEDVRPPDEVMEDIDHVRLIIIPREKLSDQRFSIEDFKKSVSRDSFKRIHSASKNQELLNVFHRTDSVSKNKYLILIEKPDKIFAFEMKGPVEQETVRKFSTPPGWKVIEISKL